MNDLERYGNVLQAAGRAVSSEMYWYLLLSSGRGFLLVLGLFTLLLIKHYFPFEYKHLVLNMCQTRIDVFREIILEPLLF